jgi:hypothetical protein
MSRARLAVFAVGMLVACHVPVNSAPEPEIGRQQFHITMANSMVRMQLQRAMTGAVRRLTDPECQKIFREFQSTSGRTLESTLQTIDQTPAQVFASLQLRDGENVGPCRSNGRAVAFTQPYGRVVFICGSRLEAQFAHDQQTVEILLIHELLHALGLGEDPPTSAEVTTRLFARCVR